MVRCSLWRNQSITSCTNACLWSRIHSWAVEIVMQSQSTMHGNWFIDTFSYPAIIETDTSLCMMDILNFVVGEIILCSQVSGLLKFSSNLSKMSHGTSLVLSRKIFLAEQNRSWFSHLQETLITEGSHLFVFTSEANRLYLR